MRAPLVALLVALLGLGLAAAAAAAGSPNGITVTPLRALRGGNAADVKVADFGHSNQPLKRQGAFKIAVRAPPCVAQAQSIGITSPLHSAMCLQSL